jgi:hypothetical protein
MGHALLVSTGPWAGTLGTPLPQVPQIARSPPTLQRPLATAIWTKHFGPRAWKDYVGDTFRAIQFPHHLGNMGGSAFCYHLFAPTSKVWYIGKALAARRSNGCTFLGPILRYREHAMALIARVGTQSHRPRYTAWSSARAWQLSLIPQTFGSEAEMLKGGNLQKQELHAPTQTLQCTPKHRHHSRPHRPFP